MLRRACVIDRRRHDRRAAVAPAPADNTSVQADTAPAAAARADSIRRRLDRRAADRRGARRRTCKDDAATAAIASCPIGLARIDRAASRDRAIGRRGGCRCDQEGGWRRPRTQSAAGAEAKIRRITELCTRYTDIRPRRTPRSPARRVQAQTSTVWLIFFARVSGERFIRTLFIKLRFILRKRAALHG